MGARKHFRAEAIKEEKMNLFSAQLRNNPTSPRKMRLVAELIRGEHVVKALHILQQSNKEASLKLEKLLPSAIPNWEQKNEGKKRDESRLYVKEVFVDSGRMLKRIQAAPQGRAHRIRKRSNHVTIILDSYQEEEINTDTSQS